MPRPAVMPEMDGSATTAAIREMPRFSMLPIIAVTAKAMRSDRERCLAAGATDFITKPVDAEVLLRGMDERKYSVIPRVAGRKCLCRSRSTPRSHGLPERVRTS